MLSIITNQALEPPEATDGAFSMSAFGTPSHFVPTQPQNVKGIEAV